MKLADAADRVEHEAHHSAEKRAGLREAGGFGLLLGVVAGADEGAGLDVAEAQGEGFVLEEGELVRRVEALHDEVVARWGGGTGRW